MKALKIFLWVTGLLVVLAVGSVVVITNLVDPNDYKPEITARVEKNTGRTLGLHGDLELAFFPWLGVKTGRVELSDREGFGSAPMLAVDEAAIRIKLLPLLKKRVEVDTVLLDGPQINLSRKTDGTTNWDDLSAKARRSGGDAGRALPDTAVLAGLVVQGISIKDGRVNWDDRFTDRSLTLKALNLNTGRLTPGEPLDVDLSVVAEGRMLRSPAAITLETTAELNENLESISLDNTNLRVATASTTADFSIETMSYALRAGLGVLNGLRGNATNGEVNTILDAPALTFNLSDESLQLPAMKIVQDDASLSASLSGAGVLSGFAEMTANGSVEARAEDVGELLKRNNLKAHLLPGLAIPVTVNFRFDLADSNLRLINLEVKSREGQGDKWLVKRKEVILPLNPDGTLDRSALTFVAGDLLKKRVKTELDDLKVKLKKALGTE